MGCASGSALSILSLLRMISIWPRGGEAEPCQVVGSGRLSPLAGLGARWNDCRWSARSSFSWAK